MIIDDVEQVLADAGVSFERGEGLTITADTFTATITADELLRAHITPTTPVLEDSERDHIIEFANWWNGTATWPRARVSAERGLWADDVCDADPAQVPLFVDRVLSNGEYFCTVLAFAKDENWDYQDADWEGEDE